MLVLGIETSCDETAAAVVKDGCEVLSNVVASQIDIHAETGGVVPEVAARAHVLEMVPVLKSALESAKVEIEEIDAIAVTKGPGLVSSLLVGTTAASTLALVGDKPVIPVNHIHSHIMANWLDREKNDFQFPILIVTVSGGHNEIFLMKDYGDFELVGETLDDAAGEAFDKVARMLGLGYPGGPIVSKMAEKGDPERFELPVVLLEKGSLDFSFSGLKTAVLNLVMSVDESERDEQFVADVCAVFQKSVVATFVEKVKRCLEKFDDVKEVHLTGGVSANQQLRAGLADFLEKRGIDFKFPKQIKYCTDNAAMIAACGYFMHCKEPEKYREWQNVVGDPRFLSG